MKRTNIYIDGFNLYYGSLKGTSYKWLDLLKFCKNLLPNNTIHQIKYFSAKVSARPHDPDQPVRQQAYWRALQTIPNLSVIEGSFLTKEISMPIARTNPQQYAKIIKTEEKGSDVNLATHLINDAYKKDFDIAVMITNDSDLLEPMRIVREELRLTVGIINPHKKPSFQLQSIADFIKPVRPWALKASQFPATLTDKDGTFNKPQGW